MFYNIKKRDGRKIFRLFVLIVFIKNTYNNINEEL